MGDDTQERERERGDSGGDRDERRGMGKREGEIAILCTRSRRKRVSRSIYIYRKNKIRRNI